MKRMILDDVSITICENRKTMGIQAALYVEKIYDEIIKCKDSVNMIFAAAPSQNEFLEAMVSCTHIDFSKVTAFHMDEYIGLNKNSAQSFCYYLNAHIFSKVGFKAVHYIEGDSHDIEYECRRYGSLFSLYPPDILCAGVGENGHIAFNDPAVADFNDPKIMKMVELDDVCRLQQVHDGCFPILDSVPKKALTLTIPTLMRAKHKVFTIPSARKAKAVHDMFLCKQSEAVPASVIRNQSGSAVFLDEESSRLLLDELGESVNGKNID